MDIRIMDNLVLAMAMHLMGMLMKLNHTDTVMMESLVAVMDILMLHPQSSHMAIVITANLVEVMDIATNILYIVVALVVFFILLLV
mmetsp:Transcript_10582/g.13268  ORF Transcript_10582/g.13268 Transcript_10582/m.13268 type:complete len:86 (-) Transcript_10582:197-454(-)